MTESQQPLDPILAGEAVYANGFQTVKPSIVSTALRTHPLRFEALRFTQDARVAEEFLINSRLRRRDVELETSVGSYFTDVGVATLSLLGQEGRHGSRVVQLPKSIALRMGLGEIVRKRRSVRMYTGDAMPLAYLGTIVRIACGITGAISNDQSGVSIALRSTPSGGGLYPVDLHIAALRVEDLARGLYVYDPPNDVLWQTGDEAQLDALLKAVAVSDQIIASSKASAIFLLVGRPWRSMRKYGPRGMRNLFLEAGAIAEHINLASVALGLGSVDCGSIYEDEADEALQVDGLYEALLHAVVLGIPG